MNLSHCFLLVYQEKKPEEMSSGNFSFSIVHTFIHLQVEKFRDSVPGLTQIPERSQAWSLPLKPARNHHCFSSMRFLLSWPSAGSGSLDSQAQWHLFQVLCSRFVSWGVQAGPGLICKSNRNRQALSEDPLRLLKLAWLSLELDGVLGAQTWIALS